jgi:hypothetical protein
MQEQKDMKEISASITILASYDDSIRISIYDNASCKEFITLKLTREQFVNATMNRLGNTEIAEAKVGYLDLVGKKMIMETIEFELPGGFDRSKEKAKEVVKNIVNELEGGWIPDTSFSSQNSFFDKCGKPYARTTIRKWE